jgi:hypothetical protein
MAYRNYLLNEIKLAGVGQRPITGLATNLAGAAIPDFAGIHAVILVKSEDGYLGFSLFDTDDNATLAAAGLKHYWEGLALPVPGPVVASVEDGTVGALDDPNARMVWVSPLVPNGVPRG